MSWKDKMKEFGGGDLAFLSEDGEVLNFVVVGEPVLLQGKYKGQPTQKIGCPIVTEDGFALLVAGKRLARKIAKYESQFDVVALQATRHGEQGDIDATYPLKVLDDVDLTSKLMTLRRTDFTPDMIDDAIKAAQDVMKQ